MFGGVISHPALPFTGICGNNKIPQGAFSQSRARVLQPELTPGAPVVLSPRYKVATQFSRLRRGAGLVPNFAILE